jgi:hypothetical protein
MKKHEAHELAERINRYWARQGWDAGASVVVTAAEREDGHAFTAYGVATAGLRNGLPIRPLSTEKVA